MAHNSKHDACVVRKAINVDILKSKEKVKNTVKTVLLKQEVKTKLLFTDLIKSRGVYVV